MDLNIAATKPEQLDIVIPDEPPFGSIVLDNEGFAWQRNWVGEREMWRSTGMRNAFSFGLSPEGGVTTWAQLCAHRKRLTLVYKP